MCVGNVGIYIYIFFSTRGISRAACVDCVPPHGPPAATARWPDAGRPGACTRRYWCPGRRLPRTSVAVHRSGVASGYEDASDCRIHTSTELFKNNLSICYTMQDTDIVCTEYTVMHTRIYSSRYIYMYVHILYVYVCDMNRQVYTHMYS